MVPATSAGAFQDDGKIQIPVCDFRVIPLNTQFIAKNLHRKSSGYIWIRVTDLDADTGAFFRDV